MTEKRPLTEGIQKGQNPRNDSIKPEPLAPPAPQPQSENTKPEPLYSIEPHGADGEFALYQGRGFSQHGYNLCKLSDFDSNGAETRKIITKALNSSPLPQNQMGDAIKKTGYNLGIDAAVGFIANCEFSGQKVSYGVMMSRILSMKVKGNTTIKWWEI